MSASEPSADQSVIGVPGCPFSDTVTKPCSSSSFLSGLKYNFRIWLFRHKKIQLHFRGVRYLLHVVAKIKLKMVFLNIGNKSVLAINHYPFFTRTSSNSVADDVAALNENSYVYGPVLNSDIVLDLTSRYSPQVARAYRNVYLQDKLLFDICHNDAIISVVRAYLGFEPILHSCCVTVDIPGEKKTDSGYQAGFHYDIAGIKSLNVFIYLSDVDCMSMPHVVIKGTHRQKRLRDIYNGCLTSCEAKRLYGDAIAPLTGPAGTVIFENTEAFHRRGELNGRGRVLVNILYTDDNKSLM